MPIYIYLKNIIYVYIYITAYVTKFAWTSKIDKFSGTDPDPNLQLSVQARIQREIMPVLGDPVLQDGQYLTLVSTWCN